MGTVTDLVKPPFANYDVVVYFGGGLFAIPFVNRYLVEPLALTWPRFKLDVGSTLANDVVSGLSLLFSIYIVGHIIAYAAFQFIEKLADRVLGKISTSILISSWASKRKRNEWVRAVIFDRVSNIKRDRAISTTIARVLFHIPVLPLYVAVYSLGVFGYYSTRVPYSVINAARAKLPSIGLGPLRLSIRTQWFKPLEHYIINRMPVTTARMYNYLVICGLFRSLSFIFLLGLWGQAYFALHYLSDGDWFLRPFLGQSTRLSVILEYGAFSVAYIFSLFSYLKFQRRYAEEAIFAFVLGPDQVSTSK